MSSGRYLLDTTAVLALVRGRELGAHIESTYKLREALARPFVCVVSHAEAQVIARRNGWGESRLESLMTTLSNLVTVDIRSGPVVDAYVAIELASQAHPAGSRNMGRTTCGSPLPRRWRELRSSPRTTTLPTSRRSKSRSRSSIQLSFERPRAMSRGGRQGDGGPRETLFDALGDLLGSPSLVSVRAPFMSGVGFFPTKSTPNTTGEGEQGPKAQNRTLFQ